MAARQIISVHFTPDNKRLYIIKLYQHFSKAKIALNIDFKFIKVNEDLIGPILLPSTRTRGLTYLLLKSIRRGSVLLWRQSLEQEPSGVPGCQRISF